MASNSMLRRCLRMLPSVARFHCNRTLTTAIYRPTINLINPVSKSNHLLGALYLTTVKPSVRFYSDSHGPTKEEVENRVMEVLKSFDKVDVSKLTMDAHFINDLGLDSLDTVEIVMAFEDEFALEISDAEAEKIFNCRDAVTYVVDAMGIE